MAKIGISCQISQNVLDLLDLLYRFGRRISEGDFPNIRLAVAEGTLLWQPFKYGRCLQTLRWDHLYSLLWHSTTDWPIVNPLSKDSMAIIMLQICSNLVNFSPVISEFMLLKLAIFAAIRPQFDDDLHMSRWRFETD